MQIKGLEKSMVTIVKAVKEIKASMNKLEEKVNKSQNEEIQEIIKAQKNLDKVIAANNDAIKRIDSEILKIKSDEAKADSDKHKDAKLKDTEKRCRYYNGGHCKYKLKCKFVHAKEICKKVLDGKKCYEKACIGRHPKICKWWQGQSGCKREDCDYLHIDVTLACDDVNTNNAHKVYPCSGCQNYYEDQTCVVKHVVKNTQIFLCLNCDDWIQEKDKILNPGWTMFDLNGYLRRDV